VRKLTALAVLAVATFAPSPPATAAEVAGAFSKGNTSLLVTAGSGYAFNESYLVLGVGVGYYLFDGLNVGLSVEWWSGSDPTLYKVTPSVTYVFHQVPLKPYIGAFYRRTYAENLPDLNSAGARGVQVRQVLCIGAAIEGADVGLQRNLVEDVRHRGRHFVQCWIRSGPPFDGQADVEAVEQVVAHAHSKDEVGLVEGVTAAGGDEQAGVAFAEGSGDLGRGCRRARCESRDGEDGEGGQFSHGLGLLPRMSIRYLN